MSLFTQTNVLDVVEGKKFPLVSVDKNTTVYDTLKILYDTGFSSLTVADPTIATFPKRIAGFIDLVDILAFLVSLVDGQGVTQENAQTVTNEFLSQRVGDLMDFSTRDHFTAILEEDSLLKVIGLLSKEGTHRVAVIDILSEVRHVLTQTDVAKVLHHNIDSLAPVSKMTIRELGIAYSDVISVHANDTALESLRSMNSHKLSAVPILNEGGVLVGTLSISDLKSISNESLLSLYTGTLLFAEKHSYWGHPKAVMVMPESTFADVIALISHAKTHRVWVVDAQHKPVGVISLTDICRAITKLHTSS